MDTVKLLNTSIDNITQLDLLEKLTKTGGFLVTPNVDHLVKLQTDYQLAKAYREADYCVCDSKILQYTSRFLGTPIQEKISGSDLFPAFYQYNKDNPRITIFLLGGLPGVAEVARNNINYTVGRNMVVDTYSPPFGFESNEAENQKIIDIIHRSDATVLAVGLGAPKQEKWIAKYRHLLPKIHIFLAIGAAIDFEAGNKPRAPQWMSKAGFEWFYRLSSEPQRLWKRYLVDSMPFFWWAAQQKLNMYHVDPLLQMYSLPIGELLHETGLISKPQLMQVLEIQKTSSSSYRLGDLIAEQGWLPSETIDFLRSDLPTIVESKQYLRLGELLVGARILQEEQLDRLLKNRSTNRQRLGQVIIKEGWVNPKTVNWFVNLQRELR